MKIELTMDEATIVRTVLEVYANTVDMRIVNGLVSGYAVDSSRKVRDNCWSVLRKIRKASCNTY